MKTHKKLVSILCAVALLVSALPAAAAVDDTSKLNSETGSESSAIYTNSTIFNGIKASDAGQYAITASDGSEVPVGMLEVNLLDQEQYSAVMDRTDISDAVKESLMSKRDQALDVGKNEQYVFIFSPRFLDCNTAGTYAIPAGRTEYTWNGHSFLIERVHTLNVSSGYQFVDKGVTTKEKASTIVSVLLTLGGLNKKLAVASGGISLLQSFYNFNKIDSVPGNAGDYAQVCVNSDIYEQWTWGKHLPTDPDWFLGVYTEKVLVKKVLSKQQYFVPAVHGYQSSNEEINYNQELKGPHFTDDWQESCEIAWANRMSTVTDPTPKWTVGSKTFYF